MATNWLATFASHDSLGTLYENTFGVKMDPASGDGLNANDLASSVHDWFGAEYLAALPGRCTLDTISLRKMPEPTSDEGVYVVSAAGGEGPESATFPKELAVLLSWKTDHPGRSGRGHIAFPLPHVTGIFASTNSYLMTSAFFTTLIAALFTKLDAGHDWGPGGADGHISHIVYSRKDNVGYDVKARIARSQPRWVERRQTAP